MTQLGLPGFGVGMARGSLVIDTSQLEQVRATVRSVANDVRAQFSTMGTGVETTIKAVSKLRTELMALAIGAGAATVFGMDSARNLRNYRIAFAQLLGDQETAAEVMREITDTANDFGIELESTLQLARSLLPILKGNTEELDNWVKRAAMLRSVFPIAARGSETRAISEYISGQHVSLQRLFNIPPDLIQEAKAQFSDYGQQLDFILEHMGATEEGARQMADAWVSVGNELKLVAATGFTPLLHALYPLLRSLREFLQELREASPEVLAFGGGLITLAAVGLPAALLLERMVTAAKALQAIGLGSMLTGLGKGGILALAAAAGAGAGTWLSTQGTRLYGRAIGDEQLAQIGLGETILNVKAGLWTLVKATSDAGMIIPRAVNGAVQAFTSGIASMTEAMASFVSWLGGVLPGWAGGDLLQGYAARLRRDAEQQRGLGEWYAGRVQYVERAQTGALEELDQLLGLDAWRAFWGTVPGPEGRGGAAAAEEAIVPLDAIQAWAEQVQQIEEHAAEQRLDATRQYEMQRADVIANYEIQIVHEAEDFARQRARQEAELQRSIAEIRADAAQREADWWADLQSRIADLREDSARRLEDMERDHQMRMERLQRDHRLQLLEAAARLDAQAVATEQRRYASQRADIEQDHERRVAQERENLAERIAQEQEGHAQRVEAARRADERRIADMVAALRRQQAIEDEDRAIRLARMAEDHERQLAHMARAHSERLAQIDRHARQERAMLDWAFIQQLQQEGKYSNKLLEYQAARQGHSLTLFNRWWDGVDQIIAQRMRSLPVPGSPYSGPYDTYMYQHGGPVPFTGPAVLHGSPGRPEYVLDAGTTDALRRMLGGGMFSQGQLVAAVAGGRSVTLHAGAVNIPIYALPGMSAADIGAEVRRVFKELLSDLAQ